MNRSGATHLRRRVVQVGLWSSQFAAAASALYLLATPQGPNRGILWGWLGASVAVTVAMVVAGRLRWIRGRHGMGVLYVWSGSQSLIIAASAALDGGLSSPYIGLLFLPLVAGAIGFAPRAVIMQGIWSTACLLVVVATVGELSAPRAALWTVAIGLTTWVASSSSRSLLTLSEDLDRANHRLAHLARVDALTGCFNHRAFHEQLRLDLARRTRGGDPISLLVLDIDLFKAVNDTHGHPVGDEVLRVIGKAMRGTVRLGDVVGRTGGEEFAVLLPDTTSDVAELIGERMRTAIADAPSPVPVTVSVGLAAVPASGWTASELMRIADEALYEAKRGGRDRLVRAEDTPERPAQGGILT
ncbi:MAG: GGDEF domain-containing protein [Nitriliruptor sp.]|uniref:GGDEF domain-containing protein n=1 Tax=Nitriliruptor sp. TaxID=2448056 RepID=UPI0034A00595